VLPLPAQPSRLRPPLIIAANTVFMLSSLLESVDSAVYTGLLYSCALGR